MSFSSSSSYQATTDHASGQNAANKVGQELEGAMASYESQLMSDPLAAVSSANRIRRLQSYLNAYRNGGNLASHEVIPRSRVAEESTSTNTRFSPGQG